VELTTCDYTSVVYSAKLYITHRNFLLQVDTMPLPDTMPLQAPQYVPQNLLCHDGFHNVSVGKLKGANITNIKNTSNIGHKHVKLYGKPKKITCNSAKFNARKTTILQGNK